MKGNAMPQALTLIFRSIRTGRFYSLVSITGLAVAIAAVVLVGALLQHELSYEKNFSASERIYRLNWINGGTGDRFATMFNPFSPPLADETPEITAAARVGVFEILVERNSGDRLSSFEQLGFVDPDFFEVFDFSFSTGSADSALTTPNSMVLTRAAAEKYFPQGDAVGQSLQLENDLTMIVTGIIEEMPATTHFPFHFIVPLETARTIYDGAGWLDSWGSDSVFHYVLLDAGVTAELLHTRIMDFADRHIPYEDWDFDIAVQPLEQIHFMPDLQNEMSARDTILNVVKLPRKKSDLAIFFAGALVLVLIASFNFMNLQVVRGVGRSRQIGILKVVGASRANVFNRMIAESMLIAAMALLAALLLVQFGIGLFGNLLGVNLGWADVLNPQVLTLVGLTTIALGLVSGAYPAWIMASQKPNLVLKGQFAHGQNVHQIRHLLVLLQFTVSIILVAVALVIYAQISYSISAPLGFEPERTAVVEIGRPEARDDYETLRLRLLEHPVVAEVSRASIIPTASLSDGTSMYRQGASPDDAVAMRMTFVSVGFFETFGMNMAAGRSYSEDFPADEFAFPDADSPVSRGGVIINEASARRAGWANPEDAVGELMQNNFSRDGTDLSIIMEIVGVVEDVHFRSLRSEVVPMVFFLTGGGGRMAVKLSRDEDIAGFSAYMEDVWRETVPEIPLRMTWLSDSVAQLYDQETRMLRLLSTVSLIAIGVACLGLFAVASLVTELRRKEVAVRKVFGASIANIIGLLSWSFLKWILLANVIAIPVAWLYLSDWLTAFVYRIDLGVIHFVLPAVGTIAIAWATVAAQAWTVARQSPIHFLRYE
jgi:putative ABC transport system permease protein